MIVVTVNYHKDQHLLDNDILLYENEKSIIRSCMITMWVFSAISFVFLILVGNLVFFHIFLIRKGLSTFDYIALVQERKENERERVNFF
jgi:hypothetical protein